MSRTDKDNPWWVTAHRTGRIEHDHRGGVCRVEELSHTAGRVRYRHPATERCLKYVFEFEYCPREDFAGRLTDWRPGCEERTAWGRRRGLPEDDGRSLPGHCPGHPQTRYRRDLPCSCDHFEPPTCGPVGELPRRRRKFTGTPRAASRDQLLLLAREYNAHGEVDGDWYLEPCRVRRLSPCGCCTR